MAYPGDYAVTENAAGGATSVVANMPEHVIGDYLVCFIAFNGNAGTVGMTGWTQIGTTVANGTNITGAVFYIYCDTASKTGTVTVTTADDYAIKVIVVKDADATTFLAGTAVSTSAAAASQFSSSSMTTTADDALVIYYHALDGVTPQAHTDAGSASMFYLSSDSTGTTANTSAGGALCWYIQRTAGATPTPDWTMNVSGARTNHVFAIRNKSGGRLPAYIDDANTVAGTVLMGTHAATTALNNVTFPAAVTIANIGPGGTGKGLTIDAAAVVGDLGHNPYSSAVSSTPAATAATTTAGFEVTLTNTRDFTNGFLVGSIIASTQKMANYNHGSIVQGGTFITLASTTTANTNYASYQVAARDSVPNTNERMVFSIQPSQTSTAFGTNGSFTANAVKRILFSSNCPTATITLYTAEWHHITKIAAAGGDANYPVDSEGLAQIGAAYRIKLIQKTGAAGLLSMVPLQIGGGDAINFQIDAGSLQFPRIYDTTKKEISYHASANAIGISYAGKSGDVIKHTNSVITSPSPYYWEINSAATSAAAWDFSGLVVVGATVTLRPVTTFTSMSFSGCSSVTTTGSSVYNCTFRNSPVLASSPANAALLTGCSMIKTTGTQHGLEITGTAANFTLDCNFSGFASSNGSTGNEAVYVNIASGNVEISYTGGGTNPSIRTAGANVTFAATPVPVTITVKDSSTLAAIPNARVLIEKVSDGTDIISGLTDANGQITTSFSYTADTPITGAVRRASAAYGTLYKPSVIAGSIAASGFDTTILLISDE